MPTVSKDGKATSEVHTVSIFTSGAIANAKSRDPKVQREEEELDVAKH